MASINDICKVADNAYLNVKGMHNFEIKSL